MIVSRVLLVLALVIAAFAGIDAALAQAGPQAAKPQPRVGPRPDQAGVSPTLPATVAAAAGNPLWSIPLASLSATRERPIFSPSRRPPPQAVVSQPVTTPVVAAPAAAAAAPVLPNLQLLGSLSRAGTGVALFTEESTKRLVQLKAGEGYAGWMLSEINGREVVLERDGSKLKMALPSPMPAVERQ